MDYQVSEKVQQLFDRLTGMEQAQKALDFIHAEEDFCVNEQLELVLIEAPTFHEEERAKAMCEKFRQLGLEEVQIDPYGNALGLW